MNLQNCLLLAALSVCMPALAELKTLVEAKETSTAYLNVPTTENSRLTFKSCDECELISVRLTPATKFYVRGTAMRFADFRAAFNKLKHSKDDYVLVSYETETNTVKSVRVAD
jgi:hypothetical protein